MQKYLPKHLIPKNLILSSLLLKNKTNSWKNKPSDWSDIRKDCPADSIALYAGVKSDYSAYDNLGFTATCAGGYNVFIDGTQFGTTYASGATCTITWSTSGITTGDDITTPSVLKAHKIWVEPATTGNNITAFRCARVSASGNEAQGLLWAHFNIANNINLSKGFAYTEYYNSLLMSITAKNNLIIPTGLDYCLYKALSLEYLPKIDYFGISDMTDFITEASNLNKINIDTSTNNTLTKIGIYGSDTHFVTNLKSLRVSNKAPFTGPTPQINVSYTDLDRNALVQLFNDLPYNVGYEVVGNPTINNGIVSNIDGNNYVYLSSVSINNSAIKIKAKLKTTRAPGDYTDIYFGNNSYLFFATSWGSAVVRFRANISDNWNTISIPLSSFPMQEDTYYWFEYSYDGIDTHTLKLSSDGETWVSNSLTLEGGLPTSIATFRLTTERTLETDLNNNSISLNDIPYFTGKAAMAKTINIVSCTGTSDLSADDRTIATDKGWSIPE